MNLEEKLIQNYEKTRTYTCCTDTVEKIMNIYNAKTDIPKDPRFLKGLCKVGENIYNDQLYSWLIKDEKSYFFTLYYLNLIGAKTLEKNQNISFRNSESKQKIIAHFYSHAGDCAKKMFSFTKDIKWKERQYELYLASVENAARHDYKHTAFSMYLASIAASNLSELTNSIKWLEKSYEHAADASKMFKKLYPKMFKVSNRQASNYAEMLFTYTEDLNWLIKSFDCMSECVQASKNSGVKEFRRFFSNALKIAKRIFLEENGTNGFKESAYYLLTSAINGKESLFSKSKVSFSYSLSSRFAFSLFKETKDIGWLKKSYESKAKCAEFLEENSFKREVYGFLERKSNDLYLLTNERNYAEESIKWLDKIICECKNDSLAIEKLKKKKEIFLLKLNA